MSAEVSALLQEQRRINEEMMTSMRAMQMKLEMLTGGAGNSTAGGVASNSGTGAPTSQMPGSQTGSAFGGSNGSSFAGSNGGSFGGSFGGSNGASFGGSNGASFGGSNAGNWGNGNYGNFPVGGGMGGGYGSNEAGYGMGGGWNNMGGGGMGFPNFGNFDNTGGSGGGKMRGGHGPGGMNRADGPYKINMLVPKELGEWDCPECGNLNWAKREKCNGRNESCKVVKKPEFIRRGGGEWNCTDCGNLNYGRRTECNVCKAMRPANAGPMPPMGSMPPRQYGPMHGGMGPRMGGMMGRGGQDRPAGGMSRRTRRPGAPEPRPGDWECPRCYNINFSYRERCNGSRKNDTLCNLIKPAFSEYKVPPVKEADKFSDTDWDCWRCGNINFAKKESCNKCDLDRSKAHDQSLRGDYADYTS